MITVYVDGENTIKLGRSSDNEATRIAFPIAETLKLFGDGGSWILLNKRPNEGTAYAVNPSRIETDENWLYWTVTATDTQYYGNGEVQLSYTVGTVVKMSHKWRTSVCASLTSGPAPSYTESWLEDLTDIKVGAETARDEAEAYTVASKEFSENAEAAADAIENMSVSATTLAPDSSATVTKHIDPDTGAVSLAFGIPKGKDGETNVFIARYNETTYAELTNALETTNKCFVAVSNGITYDFNGIVSGKAYFSNFATGASPMKRVLTLGANGWATASYTLLTIDQQPSQYDATKKYNVQRLSASSNQFKLVEATSGGGATLYKHSIYAYQPAWEDPEEGTDQQGVELYVQILSSSAQPVTSRGAINGLAASGVVCSAHGQFVDAWDSVWKIYNYEGLFDDEYMGFVTSQPYGGDGWMYCSLNDQYDAELTVRDTVTQL